MRWLLIILIGASPALADVKNNGKTIDCYCTDRQGERVELGEMTCLQVDGRMFMAQCQMSLNVPMWREVSEGCLSSSLPQSVQPSVDAGGIDAEI
ncbi:MULTISPECIES: hypothetical protein [unclassified Roseovarius]|uniref:hypothetical protein n=1 Tax=unclassified Roseovarius TaxID=2614913 RepID=UPI0027401FAE|nr:MULTISPECIES: hypothetical protein [unclassified Roseovarius]